MRRPWAWLQVILLLIGYIAVSSVLGLIWWVGPFGVLVVWWTSTAADVVFVIGSIAGAVVGVTVAKSRRNSIALSGLIACLTYGIAAEVALSAFGALVGVGSPPPDGFPSLGMVLVDAPLLGIAGVAFAAIAPALLRERVKRFLEADAQPSTK
jgi:hypothetical protein